MFRRIRTKVFKRRIWGIPWKWRVWERDFLLICVRLCVFWKMSSFFFVGGCGGNDGRHDGTQDGVADVIMRRSLQSGRWGTFWLSCGSCSYQVICNPLVFLFISNIILPRDYLEVASLLQLVQELVMQSRYIKWLRVLVSLYSSRDSFKYINLYVSSSMGFILQVLCESLIIHLGCLFWHSYLNIFRNVLSPFLLFG
jgi:hypothetical protein